jgi:hypothetical protein
MAASLTALHCYASLIKTRCRCNTARGNCHAREKTNSHPFRGKVRAGACRSGRSIWVHQNSGSADGGKLAFVIFQQGSAEVMYQSYASVEKDMLAILGDVRKGPSFLYLEADPERN